MIRLRLYFLIFIFYGIGVQGQSPELSWAKTYGNANYDHLYTLKLDQFGNVFYAGNFRDSIDIDPGPGVYKLGAPIGNQSCFIVKLDPNGNFKWVKQLQGNIAFLGLEIDNENNLLLTGGFGGICDFDPGIGVQNRNSASLGHSFLLKFDSSGNFKWVYTFGIYAANYNTVLLEDILITNSNDVILTGVFGGTYTFSSLISKNSIGVSDFFFLNISTNGIFNNVKTISNNQYTRFYPGKSKIVNNNILITGIYNGNVDFDMGPDSSYVSTGSESLYSSFILSINDTLGFNWVRRIEYTGSYYNVSTNCNINDITKDSSNNIICTGYIARQIDVNTDTGATDIFIVNSTGYVRNFVLKLNNNGKFIWVKAFDGQGHNISTGNKNEIYIAGIFNGGGDFNPAYGNYIYCGLTDLFLNCLDSNGIFNWVLTYGGPGWENQYNLAIDKYKSIYVVGTFKDSIDVIPDINFEEWIRSNGDGDVIISKFRQCVPSTSTISISACNSYTLGGITFTASGVYYPRIYNAVGCDSTITLNLTIKNTKASISMVGCDSINVNSIWYKQNGTYSQILVNAAGCDSALTINITIRNNTGSYSATACDSIRINSILYTISGIYTQTLFNKYNCDSIVTLTLNIKASSTNTLSYTSCDSLRINNIKYTTSGTYKYKLTNAVGCDSLLILNITIDHSQVAFKSFTGCDTAYINGFKYYQNGYYLQHLLTTKGCDSALNITVTIYTPVINFTPQIIKGCDSVQIQNVIYKQSGTYIHHYANWRTCDSAVTFIVTVNKSGISSIAPTYCRTATINGITYNASGNYTQHLNSTRGCDSTININLTITNTDKGITTNNNTLTANQNGAVYQWLSCTNNYSVIPNAISQSYTATQTGIYAARITLQQCVDTSQCISVTGVGIKANITDEAEVSVTPNPFQNQVTVTIQSNTQKEETWNITLWDAVGQMIFVSSGLDMNNGNDYRQTDYINTENLATGIYFVRIECGENSIIKKIIRN